MLSPSAISVRIPAFSILSFNHLYSSTRSGKISSIQYSLDSAVSAISRQARSRSSLKPSLADANDGFRDDRERAWRLMAETAESKLYWMEEIFPERVEEYKWLKDKMEKAGIRTLIADGESMDQPAEFGPYLKPKRLMDVLQSDIRRFGFLDNLAVTRQAVGAVVM